MIAIRRETLGESHGDTLASMANLARTLEKQEKWREAEPLRKEMIAIRRETLGESHGDTLVSMLSLAKIYRKQRRTADEAKVHEEAFEIARANLPADDPKRAHHQVHHGELLGMLGRFEEGGEHLLEAYRSLRQIQGPKGLVKDGS